MEGKISMGVKRLGWYIKQLFPLRYESQYREDGKPRLTIWRMWFGRCFQIRSFILADESAESVEYEDLLFRLRETGLTSREQERLDWLEDKLDDRTLAQRERDQALTYLLGLRACSKPKFSIYHDGDELFVALPGFVNLQKSEVEWLDATQARMVEDLYTRLCLRFRDAQAKKVGFSQECTPGVQPTSTGSTAGEQCDVCHAFHSGSCCGRPRVTVG